MAPQVSILTALVGVGGALLGAAITQILSARREKKQWERQSALEEVRWQRERADRQEQWGREDESRWNRERYEVFAILLSTIENWIDEARRAKPFLAMGRSTIAPENGKKLKELQDELEKALVSIELLAPEDIRSRTRGMYILTSMFWHRHTGRFSVAEANELTQEVIDLELDKIVKSSLALREAVRIVLGIEAHDAKDK